jgi:hypothetical protein
MWQDKTGKSVRQSFTAMRGSRWIILDAGSQEGFIPNALLVFQSKSTADYHEEMDGARFLKWYLIFDPMQRDCPILFTGS